uniref:Uncharacterized protein n=1 Tax=Lepeophtheirus salmonis TaxID=72036 RepID=A0A0K2UL22_LEPSM
MLIENFIQTVSITPIPNSRVKKDQNNVF